MVYIVCYVRSDSGTDDSLRSFTCPSSSTPHRTSHFNLPLHGASSNYSPVSVRTGSSMAQSPPQSAPPFRGSQLSVGFSRQTCPLGHLILAMPPQNRGPMQIPGQSAAIRQFSMKGLSTQTWFLSGHGMPVRPAQMGFKVGFGVALALALDVLDGTGHFCRASGQTRLRWGGGMDQFPNEGGMKADLYFRFTSTLFRTGNCCTILAPAKLVKSLALVR